RVEWARAPGETPAVGHPRSLGTRAGRSGWPTRQEASPRKARFCVFGAHRVRPLRVFDRRRDQEAALRLLPLHGIQGPVRRALRARGGDWATLFGTAWPADLR